MNSMCSGKGRQWLQLYLRGNAFASCECCGLAYACQPSPAESRHRPKRSPQRRMIGPPQAPRCAPPPPDGSQTRSRSHGPEVPLRPKGGPAVADRAPRSILGIKPAARRLDARAEAPQPVRHAGHFQPSRARNSRARCPNPPAHVSGTGPAHVSGTGKESLRNPRLCVPR
jgi:hypothetical protein